MKIYATLTRAAKMTEDGEVDLDNLEQVNEQIKEEESKGAADQERNGRTSTFMESAYSFVSGD